MPVRSRTDLGQNQLPPGFDHFARRTVRSFFEAIQTGQIVVRERGRHEAFGKLTDDMPLTTVLTISDPRFYTELAFGGTLGAAQAWIKGFWSCDELTNLVRILLRNREVLDAINRISERLHGPTSHERVASTLEPARGLIEDSKSHFELGESFFAGWLDSSLHYSTAFFARPDMSLEDAVPAQYERMCRVLNLREGSRLLDINAGWGGFAIYAARRSGCRVTAIAGTPEQFEFAYRRVQQQGLAELVTVIQASFRELGGQYDRLVSNQSLGLQTQQEQAKFLRRCSELLQADGEMLLQATTLADQHLDEYLQSAGFIRREIFPGSCLPSLTTIAAQLAEHTDLRIVGLDDQALHQAQTLRCWLQRFSANLEQIRSAGFGEEFLRMWVYYLSYCEGAFIERMLGSLQAHLIKPHARPATNRL